MNLPLLVFRNVTYLLDHVMHLVAVARLISAFELATLNQGPKSTLVHQFALYLAINADVMFVFFDGILPQLEAKTYVTLHIFRGLIV